MNNPENIPTGISTDYYYELQNQLLSIMQNLDVTNSSTTNDLMIYFESLGPLPTVTNNVDIEMFCDNAVQKYFELSNKYKNTPGEQIITNTVKKFINLLLDNYKSYVQDIRNQIKILKPISSKPPPPYIPGTNTNSPYTDCAKGLYSSEAGYYQCENFNKLNAPGPQKKQSIVGECFPTYGKNSPAVCLPDTTERCASGLMNVSNNGFPPCCNDNVPDSCIIKEGGGPAPSTPSGVSPVPPPLVDSSVYTRPTPIQPVENLSGAASNCIAKNPNYPTVKGSCYYNENNPCPTHYETVDTRFGTKMCCAPKDSTNANCFSTKSTFGSSSSSTNNNNTMLMILGVCIILFILLKKK